MGILVPKGSTVSSHLTKQIKEQEKEKVYLDFIERFILEKGKAKAERFADIFIRYGSSKTELTDEEQRVLAQNYKKIADEILETLGDEEAEIATFTFSRGGNRTSLEKSQLKRLKEKGANVEYTAITVNGIIVLEPIGQLDNATYIIDARNNESEDRLGDNLEKIKGISRDKAVSEGLMFKIIHDISDKKEYDFDAKHVARVLELVMGDTDNFIEVLKENNGCGLKRISQKLSNTTPNILQHIKNGIERQGLEGELREFMNSQIKNEKIAKMQETRESDKTQEVDTSIGEGE